MEGCDRFSVIELYQSNRNEDDEDDDDGDDDDDGYGDL